MDILAYLAVVAAFLLLVASASHSLALVAHSACSREVLDTTMRRYIPLGIGSGIGVAGCAWWVITESHWGLGMMVFGLWPASVHLWHFAVISAVPDSYVRQAPIAPWLLPLLPTAAMFFVCNGFTFDDCGLSEAGMAICLSIIYVAQAVNGRLLPRA